MKRKNISDAIGYIDENIIVEAIAHEKTAINRRPWMKWTAVAACLAVIVGAGIAYPILTGGRDSDKPYDYDIMMPENALLYPWEYLASGEKYVALEYGGVEYSTVNSEIDGDLIGERLGVGEGEGYDICEEKAHTSELQVYAIDGVETAKRVAVMIDGEYYVYRNNEYAPPETLGEFVDDYSLAKTVPLVRFSVSEGYGEGKYYTTEKGADIWALIVENGNAEFKDIDQSEWIDETKLISFTVSSDALGVYKKAMYVSENGYLWTNMCEWGYTFNIGEDAAKAIIELAKKDAHKAVYEPYEYSVAGQITEIKDGYVMISDSVLYADPSKGVTYRLSLDSIYVRRAIEFAGYEVGDFVVVRYRGEINSENEISGVRSIDRGQLTDERNVVVPE